MAKKKKTSPTSSKTKPARSPKTARKAGLDFEREVANALRHIFPEAERQLEFQASQAEGVDLKGTGNLKIQCKNRQAYASIATINEIRATDGIPVLVTKGVRQPAMAVLPFENFVQLLEAAYANAVKTEEVKHIEAMVESYEAVIEKQLELDLPSVNNFI